MSPFSRRQVLHDYCTRRERLLFTQESKWRRFMRWLAKVLP
jgi:hypothetical protein